MAPRFLQKHLLCAHSKTKSRRLLFIAKPQALVRERGITMEGNNIPSIPMGAFRDIHGIINLDEISRVFTVMLQRLDQQDRVISQLQHTLTAFVSKTDFIEKIARMDDCLTSVEERLKRLQIASTGRVLDKE